MTPPATEPTDGLTLHTPDGSSNLPVDVSIVVPALNERVTISEFVEWCHIGLAEAGVSGQILIVDSSTDETPMLAQQRGAEVLRTPKRGLGRAYIDSIPFIRGRWVIMGDADLTYDFRDIKGFVQEFRKGAEFVMGSRFRGKIEKGSMPALHRYFGTPLTTWILNRLYKSTFSDIHCGMRGLTTAALQTLDLRSQSWEYASEMVLKAARLGLKTAEVPVKFYKDREGRLSHHRRVGWLSPWLAGWINLKIMLIYTPDSFLLKPGVALMVFGLALSTILSFGPVSFGPLTFDLYWMLFGVSCATLGFSSIQIGVIACLLHRLRPGVLRFVEKTFSYDAGMFIAALVSLIGFMLVGIFAWHYVVGGLKLTELSRPAILGLLLVILGFQTFGFTLLLEMLNRVNKSARG